jgi:hypothetical protein
MTFIEDVIDFLGWCLMPLAACAVMVIPLGGILMGLMYLTSESPEQTKAVYDAWCRLHRRQDLSIEDWKMLRGNYLLPGMDAKRAVEAEQSAAIAVGAAAAASAR